MAVDPLIPIDPSVGKAAEPPARERATGADFLFHLIDIVNPLQHIPIVSTIYRKITGDEIAPAARLLGGGLFAGPLGLIAATANIVAEGVTGRDFGERAIALFDSETNEPLLAGVAELGPPTPEPLFASTAEPRPALQPTREATTGEKSPTYAVPPPPLSAGFLATMLTEGDPPASRALVPDLTVQSGLADTILDALDKYQAMARERNRLTGQAADDKVSEDFRYAGPE